MYDYIKISTILKFCSKKANRKTNGWKKNRYND